MPALARLAADCARGGLDLIKDDHSLADQRRAPFRDRVLAVAEHVARANRQSGRNCLYVPNLTGPVDSLADRLDDLRDAGVRAAMVAPLLLGLDAVRALAASSGVALVGHPSFAGSLVAPRQGFAPELLFGDLFRIAGCDVVIYPNAGGRFPFTLGDCRRIQHRLLAPLGAPATCLRHGRGRNRRGPPRTLAAGVRGRYDLPRRRQPPGPAGRARRGGGVE